uniref:Uncharacterized protein n=1 Tax=Ditylenchus dipsaci TaxID=166011 RepID=A0A915EF96_9BILA
MFAARLQIEQLGDANAALESATKAVISSQDFWLAGRCNLLYAFALSMKAESETCFATKKSLMQEKYSLVRNLDMAQERCQDSLDINLENPLQLFINSLLDFPSHYGLLVLRLKLEAKYGRIEEALQTSKSLLSFWRKVSLPADCTFDEEASHHNGFSGDSLRAKPSTLTTKMNSKEALVPVTPMFTAPLGISTTTLAVTPSLGASNLDIAETNSMLDKPPLICRNMEVQPPLSFRVQANIWVELAEFFLEVDRASDIQACALYLKGRLFLIRAEKCMDTNAALSKRLKVEAKSCFLGALSIFPAHIPSLTFLSKLYILEHNLKMAEKMMRDVIAIDPLQQKCWHSLGRILAEEQRIEEANECFQTAGSLNFSTPLIHLV